MDFTVSGILFTADYSSFLVALAATLFCFLLASAVVFRRAKLGTNPNTCDLKIQNPREDGEIDSDQELPGRMSGCCVGGGMENGGERAVDRQTGTSMMEQLVPEITTHALSYLDYPSLCRLSMTNSLMHKAANDDNAWKALYRKDFTLEQDNMIPPNGWKAYYAATRAIVNVNSEFLVIIRERSLQAMGQFWLNADYVKCCFARGASFSGKQIKHFCNIFTECTPLFPTVVQLLASAIIKALLLALPLYNAVMESWRLVFSWGNVADLQIREVRTRVLSNMAWVTMRAYIDIAPGPYNLTSIYEFHNGRWCMVHHHSTALLVYGGGQQP